MSNDSNEREAETVDDDAALAPDELESVSGGRSNWIKIDSIAPDEGREP